MESIETLRAIVTKRASQKLKHWNILVMLKKNFYILIKTDTYPTV